jgi:hypothetical protein
MEKTKNFEECYGIGKQLEIDRRIRELVFNINGNISSRSPRDFYYVGKRLSPGIGNLCLIK